MKLVVVESPFAGDIEGNIAYAKKAVYDCLKRNESPIASHLLFTQPGILNDDVPGERKLGIAAGHEWIAVSDTVVVYADRGISLGMLQGMKHAVKVGIPIEIRFLGEE